MTGLCPSQTVELKERCGCPKSPAKTSLLIDTPHDPNIVLTCPEKLQLLPRWEGRTGSGWVGGNGGSDKEDLGLVTQRSGEHKGGRADNAPAGQLPVSR